MINILIVNISNSNRSSNNKDAARLAAAPHPLRPRLRRQEEGDDRGPGLWITYYTMIQYNILLYHST